MNNTTTQCDKVNQHKLNLSSKKKIMCRFYMMGTCTKGENCIYLHNEIEKNKRVNNPIFKCPMYDVGYCKNGPLCNLKHDKKEDKEFDLDNDIIPIWYIEHYFDKPIHLIFRELEQKGGNDVQEIWNKYNYKPLQMNMFNVVNVNNNNVLISNGGANTSINNVSSSSVAVNGDVYANKKNSIECLINNPKLHVVYHLISFERFSDIKCSMDTNTIKLTSMELVNKVSDKMHVHIGIIYDKEYHNYMGFLRIKHQLHEKDKDSNVLKVEWLWRTKLHYTKLSHLINGDNECDVDSELGNYLCRVMMKRLTKEEVMEFMREKKEYEKHEEEEKCKRNKDDNHNNHSNNSNHSNSNSSKTNVYVTKIKNVHVNINHHHNYNYSNNKYYNYNYNSNSNFLMQKRSRSYNSNNNYYNKYHNGNNNKYHKY